MEATVSARWIGPPSSCIEGMDAEARQYGRFFMPRSAVFRKRNGVKAVQAGGAVNAPDLRVFAGFVGGLLIKCGDFDWKPRRSFCRVLNRTSQIKLRSACERAGKRFSKPDSEADIPCGRERFNPLQRRDLSQEQMFDG